MSKKSTTDGLHSFELELESEDRAALSAVGANGNRYHVWIAPKEPLRRQDGWLYCNPPAGVDYRQPGYFSTRQYPLNTRYTGMDAIVDKMMEVANRDGLLAKARSAYAAERAAEAESQRQRERDAQIREAAPALFAAAKVIALTPKIADWLLKNDAKALQQINAAIAQAEGRP